MGRNPPSLPLHSPSCLFVGGALRTNTQFLVLLVKILFSLASGLPEPLRLPLAQFPFSPLGLLQ